MSDHYLPISGEETRTVVDLVNKTGEYNVVIKKSKTTKVRTWKKPIGKPKRPLSAYTIYFKLERDRIVNGKEGKVYGKEDVDQVRIVPIELMPKRRDRKTHGKVGFGDLAKLIGSQWKQLSDEEKFAFNERAKLEKVRYSKDVEEWVQKTKNEKVDDSNPESTPCSMALGGKLGRIFLGDNNDSLLSSRTDTMGVLQSIFPGPDYHHCEAAAARSISTFKIPVLGRTSTSTSCTQLDDNNGLSMKVGRGSCFPLDYHSFSTPLDNCFSSGDMNTEEVPVLDFPSSMYQMEKRRMSTPGTSNSRTTMENSMKKRNHPLMIQRFLNNHNEEGGSEIIHERLPLMSATKRAHHRAMSVHGDVAKRTFGGYGICRKRSFVATSNNNEPLLDPSLSDSSYPLFFHRQKRQMLASAGGENFRSCSLLPISRKEETSYVASTGRPDDHYCRGDGGQRMLVQSSNHIMLNNWGLDNDSDNIYFDSSSFISDINHNVIHRSTVVPTTTTRHIDTTLHRFGANDYPINSQHDSMLVVNDYGRFQNNNNEEEYNTSDDNHDITVESMENDCGNFPNGYY